MKKQFIGIVSLLLLALVVVNNAEAACRYWYTIPFCMAGDTLYSYIYNRVPGSVIQATAKGQTVNSVVGQWIIDQNKAYYRDNIKMHMTFDNILENNAQNTASTSYTIHLDILTDGQKGSCDLTYDYEGSMSKFDNMILQGLMVEFGKIHLQEMHCTDHYDLKTRHGAIFPNSLVLYKN